jgi:hypothetical protein
MGGDPAVDRRHQIDHLVGEPVLVPEPVAGRPPVIDVGMFRLGDQDAPETLFTGRIRAVVEHQRVHVLEVERE